MATFTVVAQPSKKYNPFLDENVKVTKEGNFLRFSKHVTVRLVNNEWVVYYDFSICTYHTDPNTQEIVSIPYTGNLDMLKLNLAWQYDWYLYDEISVDTDDAVLFDKFIIENEIK